MRQLTSDANGLVIQCFAPTKNIAGATSLAVEDDGIIAFLLPTATTVQINGTGDTITYPAGVYAVDNGVSTITFGTATDVAVMM